MSTQTLFTQIQAQGYRGGYSRVTDFIRAWRGDSAKSPSKAFVPMSFELGEAFQFDWSEEGLLVGGVFHHMQPTSSCAPAGPSGWWPIPVMAMNALG